MSRYALLAGARWAQSDAAAHRRTARERTGEDARAAWSAYRSAQRFRRTARKLARKVGGP